MSENMKNLDSLPRLPMLFFDPKPVESLTVDFETPLRRFIRKNYSDEDPAVHQRSIRELDLLRRDACNAPRTKDGADILKRYYAQLFSLRNRFKMAQDEANVDDLIFQWRDTYSERVNSGDITFEMLCIILNIGLLYLELGSLENRGTDETMKECCVYFQQAAYCFEQVNELSGGYARSKDMTRDLVSLMQQLSLAQAQECVFEKAVCDSRKPLIVAKLAAQVSEYYEMCILIILNDRNESIEDATSSRDVKSWKKYAEFKTAYFSALSLFFMGWSCMEVDKPNDPNLGEAIAWFTASQEKLAEANKFAKGLDRSDWSGIVADGVKSMLDLLNKKLEVAKKENDFIYHSPIPSTDKLTAVKGASLVKPMPFSVSDPQILGRDIFSNLVPIEAHVTSSLYSDMKDNLLREVSKKIEDKNVHVESVMSSLNLSAKTLRPSVTPISDQLIDICAELHLKGNYLETVEKKLSSLDVKNAEINEVLLRIQKMIDLERSEEKEHQKLFGRRPESTLIETLERDLLKQKEALKDTKMSDAALKEKWTKFSPELKAVTVVSPKDLNKLLPEPESIPIDETVVKRIEYLLGKVEEMKQQRIKLESDLRISVNKDDVLTKVLMASNHQDGKVEELFEQELKKFDDQVKLIDMNLSAQDKIVAELVASNADYAPTRKAVMEAENKRRQRTQEIISSYETIKKIDDKIASGLNIYRQLLETVTSLETKVKSVCQLQSEERLKNKPTTTAQSTSAFRTMSTLATQLPSPQQMVGQPIPQSVPSAGPPKLKDYLPYMNRTTTAISSPPAPIPPSVSSSHQVYSGAYQQPVAAPAYSGYQQTPASQPYQANNHYQNQYQQMQPNYGYGVNYHSYEANPGYHQQQQPQPYYSQTPTGHPQGYGQQVNHQGVAQSNPQQYWQNGQQYPITQQQPLQPVASRPAADLLSDDIPESVNQSWSILSPTPTSQEPTK